MSIQIIYQPLLHIQLWHDYILGQPDPPTLPDSYDISDLFTLVPTSECVRTLKNLRWVYRPNNRGGQIFAQVKAVDAENFATQFPIKEPHQLTFWLIIKNPYFANFSNLPLTTPGNTLYYFSNLSNNQGHNLFLTHSLPTYTPEREYAIGEFVTHEGELLEALTYIGSAEEEINEDNWQTIEPNSQYVSALDRLSWQSFSRTQIIPNLNPGDNFSLKLINANEQETFIFQGTAPPNHPPESPLTVNLNFGQQRVGKYQLTLNDTRVDEFVLKKAIAASNAWGLVEIILNDNLVSREFSPLEQSGQQTLIRPKTYVIRWKNRSTRWRYHYEESSAFEPEDFSDFDQLFDLDPSQEQTYATKDLFGLLLRPSTFLTNQQSQRLPAPGVTRIVPQTDDNQQITAIFSDIYL
ncbi:MAG: hypothetical protein QNJ33_02460 [Crocosphaera sp.]|nr:hypothetical protein [Crocosphaera sp.]